VDISDTGIDWPSDDKYFSPKLQSQMWLDTSNERVRVWMRVAALPDFKKLWGRINADMVPGNYILNISNSTN
jgi:hypothetical protein